MSNPQFNGVWPPINGAQDLVLRNIMLSLPSDAGFGGDVLTADGAGGLSWAPASGGGSLALAAFGSTPNANGGSASGLTLTLQPADATHPGGLSIGAQAIGGPKTFASSVFVAAAAAAAGLGTTDTGAFAIGAFYVGSFFGTGTSLSLGRGWIAANSDGSYNFAYDNASLILNNPSGGVIKFRITNADVAKFTTTQLDMTALGTGGAILLKDASGTIRTCTISSGGAWVIV